jgi:hypothetical protein
MARLLITFPSNYSTKFAVGIYDLKHNNFKWLDIPENDDVKGAIGALCERDKCFILLQLKNNFENGLLIIFKDGSSKYLKLNSVRDAHSIIRYNGDLLVNNTANNNVIKLRFDEKYDNCLEELYYEYCYGAVDMIHLNSIIEWNNSIYVTMFGEKGLTWKDALDGKVININENKVIASELIHPHSLKVIDNKLGFLESKRGKLHLIDENNKHDIVDIDGYLRGLDSDCDNIYIGKNALRRKSKSMGLINDINNVKVEEFYSEIIILNKNNGYKVDKRLNITALGSEVYDIVVLNEDNEIKFPLANEDAHLLKNMWLENELLNLQLFIEYGLPTEEPKILSFGPESIRQREDFNIQSNGQSAIWIKGENINYRTKVVLNGESLESFPSKELITAYVPRDLYMSQGKYSLYLIDTKTNKKSNEVFFSVV